MKRALVTAVGLLLLGVLAVCVAGASAWGATRCTNGTLTGTINGDVSAGFGCDLSQVRLVKGDVKVNPGGSLTIQGGSSITITHDVESKKAAFIDIEAGSIGDDVEIEETSGTTVLFGATVNHNVEVDESTADVQINSVKVGGDVSVHDNKGHNPDGAGYVEVGQSTIHGNVAVRRNWLTGSDTNILLVDNGAAANGSIGRDLKVYENAVMGGTINQVQVYFNDVTGDADVYSNVAKGGDDNQVQTHENNVKGELDVHENYAAGGSANVIDVSGNTVRSGLFCFGNRPRPTDDLAGPNTGRKWGECKNL